VSVSAVKILVVDDDESVRDLVSTYLESAGYDVECCSSVWESLKSLARATPDAILSDISMPEMDGFRFLGELKNLPTCSTVPVIMITAQADLENIKKAVELGAVDYIVKPFQKNALVEKVKTAVQRVAAKEASVPRSSKNAEIFVSLPVTLVSVSEDHVWLKASIRFEKEAKVGIAGFLFEQLGFNSLSAKVAEVIADKDGGYSVLVKFTDSHKGRSATLRDWVIRNCDPKSAK
jgi:DNA-binding response OmpR family regulator